MMRGALLAWAVAVAIGAGAAGHAAAEKSATFKVTAVQSGPQGQITMTSQVWVTPTRARADMKHPLAGAMKVLVSNGHVYQLNPASKQGIKGPLPESFKKSKDPFAELVSKLAFDADDVLKAAKKTRSETVSGYRCDVFTASRKQEGAARTITVWVPVKMDPRFPIKAILNTDVRKPGIVAKETLTITLSDIKLNGAIPASVFAIPSGYKITEGKVSEPPR